LRSAGGTATLNTALRKQLRKLAGSDFSQEAWGSLFRDDFIKVIEQCLLIDPGERPSAHALARDLGAIHQRLLAASQLPHLVSSRRFQPGIPNFGPAMTPWQLDTHFAQRPDILGIDAICIDQENVLKRSHQVGLMKDIYAQAVGVTVWAGQSESDSNATEYQMSRSGASQQSVFITRRQAGIRKWLLGSTKFGERPDIETPVLFLNGKPGSGETVLSSSIFERLQASCDGLLEAMDETTSHVSMIHLSVLEFLSSTGPDLNHMSFDGVDGFGWTALQLAVQNGDIDALQLLLENGCDFTQVDRFDRLTPLHIAARYGREDVVSFLLAQGLDPNMDYNFEKTLRMQPKSGLTLSQSYEVLYKLLVDEMVRRDTRCPWWHATAKTEWGEGLVRPRLHRHAGCGFAVMLVDLRYQMRIGVGSLYRYRPEALSLESRSEVEERAGGTDGVWIDEG